MTIHRKSKRRSHIRIRRYSQKPSASTASTATSAVEDAQLTDESTLSNQAESIGRVQWEPRVIRMTPVESAISTAVDRRNDSDDSEVVPRVNGDATPVAPIDSQDEDQEKTAEAQSEQLPQHSADEQQSNAVSELPQDARSAQPIEDEQIKGPVADPTDTKSNSSEASGHDSVDFLMQDFMNSHPPPLPPEEVTWDIKIEPRPLPKGSRIAKYATISTLLVSVFGIGTFIAYNKLVVPTPVVLGMGSGDVELPAPIHLSDKNGEQYIKQNSNKRSNVNVPSNPSEAPAQLSKQPTSSQIIPETTSSTATSSTEKPTVDQGSEIATTGQPAPQSETKLGKDSESDQLSGAETAGVENRASAAQSASEGSALSDTDPTYRQAVEKAFKFHKRSQRAKAKKEYQRALDINPNGAEALGKLAFYSLEESKYTDAIELAERATRIDPSNSEGWIVLGAARQATSDRKGAMLAYRKCSESTGQYVRECRRLLR